MAQELKASLQARHIELISGKSAKLVFDLVNTQLSHSKTIDSQSTRLNLLDSMLEITSQLENRPALADILHTSLLSLQTHVQAEYGLAFVFHADGSSDISHTADTTASDDQQSLGFEVQAICRDLDQQQRFTVLSQPILSPVNTAISYNTILPLWHQDHPLAALLMFIPGDLSREQHTVLNMTSIHLTTATKTLQQFKHLEDIATNDALTGIYNRRYFDQKLLEEVSRIQRSKLATLTCTFVDIDNFKQVNDNYGHQVGDIALKEIAKSIANSIRDYDTCARYGGDEFVILLPADSLEGLDHIEQVGLRMLKNIAEISIPEAPELSIAASIGMATQSSEILDGERLLKLADLAVYQAKEAGKDCLRIHSDEQFHYVKGDT
ncbi:MAG: GGDEF domain-containing protein [Mariprofundus sp.]|nr:GGDEF domain-containing protein [Mariprofundus sp.]